MLRTSAPSPHSTLIKTTVQLTVAASVLFALAGCGGSESSDSTDVGNQAPQNHTVSAEFNDGGMVSPEQQIVPQGGSTEFEVSTNSGYEVVSASGCSGGLSGDTYTTGAINSDCMVSIEFGLINVEVTSKVIGEGQVEPETLDIPFGGSAQMQLFPDQGHQLKSVDGCPGDLQEQRFLFENQKIECQLVVEFIPLFTVDTVVNGQGSVYPKSQLAAYDDQLTFDLEPYEHYRVGEVTGCSGELNQNTFVVDPLQESCTLKVSFEHQLIEETWVIPDLIDQYSAVCKDATVFFAIPVDLNGDQYQDLFVHYFCGAGEFQGYTDEPAPDAFVALRNNGDGTFDVINEEVFGQSHVELGGHARKFDQGDLTGNGLTDFAFAMNWEDGRSPDFEMINATEPTVVIALEQGKYEVVRLGERSWGHGVSIIPNLEGGNDVLFAGFEGGGPGPQVFRYSAGQWLDVRDEYPLQFQGWAGSARSIPKGLLNESSVFGIGTGGGQDYLSLDLWRRDNSGWSMVDQFKLEVAQRIQMIPWQGGQPMDTTMVEFDGELYLDGGMDQMCLVEDLDGNGTPGIAAKISLGVHETLDEFDEETIYSQGDFRQANRLAVLKLSESGFTQVNNAIINEHLLVNYNFFHCRDLNNNGLTDIVAYGYSDGSSENTDGGRPLLYLNNGEGKFELRPLIDIPVHTHLNDPGMTNRFQGRMYDMNGNGIEDILLFGTTTDFGSGEFQIHILRDSFTLQ